MPYTETGAEKVKRKAYENKNRERALSIEKEKNYERYGTTEQNIPQVNPMGDVAMPMSAVMKKGGTVKKFENGGDVYQDYEEKNTRKAAIRKEGLAPYEIKELEMEMPKKRTANRPVLDAPTSGSPGHKAALESNEKALQDLQERQKLWKRPSSSGAAGSNELLRAINKPYKSGGKISSASSRADGCAIRGKTRA